MRHVLLPNTTNADYINRLLPKLIIIMIERIKYDVWEDVSDDVWSHLD